ncbi:MAG: M20/M25/M40 family metallo-hydrolase [Verrucomicrobiales bacterium]|nr:M20/M25/M40 family metallo-hydrolase [Verrucomicrobiales bacterium]
MEPIDESRLRERLIQLTRDLVLIESTDDLPGERSRCFQLIRNHLEEVPGLEITMVEKNGYESLLAFPGGETHPGVLLCGHLDVVKHNLPGSYRSEIRDGRIYGPGAGDMKGQLAIMIELVRQLGQESPGISVGLAITSDEERGGENGVRFLVEEEGLRCGVAIIPDGGSITDITVEEKGIIHLRVSANGKSAHAARPWLGENAIEELSRSLTRVRDWFSAQAPNSIDPDDTKTHWFPTCSLTMISSPNNSPNRIPGEAEAVLDIRFIPPETSQSMLEKVRELLGAGVIAEPIVSAEPTHLSPDERFLGVIREVTGTEPRLVHASGGSDGRFFCAEGIPVLLSRPRVGNLHGRDEWIEIDSMLAYFEICRRYIHKVCPPLTD